MLIKNRMLNKTLILINISKMINLCFANIKYKNIYKMK